MNTDMIINEILQQIPQPLWENWYIKEKIGSGSFSSVYRVEAKRVNRVDEAALKIEPIFPDERFANDEERSLSFLEQKRKDIEEESAIMYKLRDCPNIVSYEEEAVKEFIQNGNLAGYIFLIRMELLQNVYDMMTSRQLNTDEANIIRLAKEIGNGLKAAHDIGVIHRDVKPSNFFISKNGTYKLGDFNIAKQTVYTRSFAGTEGYIAPEVYRAKSGSIPSYSAQADIYSLGICLYQFMNNGLFPFEDTVLTEEAIDKRMSGEELPPPSNASDSFSKVIMKACAFQPADRYANMSEMLDDLDKLNAPKADVYVSGAGFAAPKSTATVYAGNTSYPSDNVTKYADSSVYMQTQAVESRRSSKKAIITISAIIALIAVLGGLLAFVANNMKDKKHDNGATIPIMTDSSYATETATSMTDVLTTEATTTTTINIITTTDTSEATETTTQVSSSFIGIVNTASDDLNVRDNPSTSGNIIGKLPKGTKVTAFILEDNSEWYRVEYAEKNLNGYCSAQFIINTETESSFPSYPIGSGYVDYTIIDVDNDGNKELIEVYENNYDISYVIYDSEQDYHTVIMNETGMIGTKDYIVLDPSTNKTHMCYMYAGSHSQSLTDSDGFVLWHYQQERTEDGSPWGETKYYIGAKEVTMEEMRTYSHNLIILYSYADPNGDFL